jgi:arylsulfatase A
MRARETVVLGLLVTGACSTPPSGEGEATTDTSTSETTTETDTDTGTDTEGTDAPPNVILIFADDLGWADLGVYGAEHIATPRLDALAAEGARFMQFYAGNSVCTPSRAVLLSGRYGARQILAGTLSGVYWPFSREGMSSEQITLAELLRDSEHGYATALVGKWHLGHMPDYGPLAQGFESFFGLPYSNDMVPLPLLDGTRIVETLSLAAQAQLTELYTERILAFMADSVAAERPFFVYYPSHAPHIPLAAGEAFAGSSPSCASVGADRACGAYADQVAELDWSVGEILDALATLGVADNTLVIFTSDNGPWLSEGIDAGDAGVLREGKGSTFEGGYRVPAIIRWPGVIEPGTVIDEPATAVDLFATIAAAAGVALPERAYDGFDLAPLLAGEGPRDPSGAPFSFLYYRLDNLTPGAYREGQWKYKAAVVGEEAPYAVYDHGELLFDLDADPGEQVDLSASEPERVMQLRTNMEALDLELRGDPHR